MQTNELTVAFNGVFGSHLYGLSTPLSDLDYKGVYMPTKQDLIFRTYKESIESQTPEIDTTLYAITKFVNILAKCDTVSLDMIHTPKEFTVTSSPLWEQLKSYRQDIYCKSFRGSLGYIRTQASKYGHKVDRYEEVSELLEYLEHIASMCKISETPLAGWVTSKNFKYIKYCQAVGDIKENIDICGARYQTSAQVKYLKQGLEAKISQYGNRTLKGSLSGGDWKSMSHSYRVLLQLNEIIETRDLVFPLVKANEIMQIKLGQLSQNSVMGMISDLYNKTEEALANSDLPEYSDMTRMKNAVMNYYE